MKTSFEEDQEAETLLNGSLNGDSLPFAFSQRAKNARNLHWKSLAFALFVGLSIGVFMVVATGGLPRSWEPRQGSAALQPRCDYILQLLVAITDLVNAVPIVPVTFNRDSLWERPLGDPEGDLAWGSLIPGMLPQKINKVSSLQCRGRWICRDRQPGQVQSERARWKRGSGRLWNVNVPPITLSGKRVPILHDRGD